MIYKRERERKKNQNQKQWMKITKKARKMANSNQCELTNVILNDRTK